MSLFLLCASLPDQTAATSEHAEGGSIGDGLSM